MNAHGYIMRLKRMDKLIRRKATGCPDVFANKMGIKRRSLFLYLNILKELGAEIEYQSHRNSYIYKNNATLWLEYRVEEPNKIKGGQKNRSAILLHPNLLHLANQVSYWPTSIENNLRDSGMPEKLYE